ETESGKLEALQAALAAAELRAAFDLKFQGLGFFPNEKRPRVLWMGIQAPPSLGHLVSEIETALAGFGFPRETRSFAPHLTLARLEGGHLSVPLRSSIEKSASQEFGLIRATEFHLIESKLKSTGAEYTTVQTFQLASER